MQAAHSGRARGRHRSASLAAALGHRAGGATLARIVCPLGSSSAPRRKRPVPTLVSLPRSRPSVPTAPSAARSWPRSTRGSGSDGAWLRQPLQSRRPLRQGGRGTRASVAIPNEARRREMDPQAQGPGDRRGRRRVLEIRKARARTRCIGWARPSSPTKAPICSATISERRRCRDHGGRSTQATTCRENTVRSSGHGGLNGF